MVLIQGKEVAAEVSQKTREIIESLPVAPVLAIVRVGDNPADVYYENSAKKRAEKLGCEVRLYTYPGDISHVELYSHYQDINEDSSIDGILLFRPLPKQIDEKEMLRMTDPDKDIDCITNANLAKVFTGEEGGFYPCTALACMKCIEHAGVELAGKNAVVIGRSLVVGKPLSMMLLRKNATVTICHSKTKELPKVASGADILVSCIGRANFIKEDFVKEGAVVIDVGINETEDGTITGDVDFDSVAPKTSMITPVPGGVGSVTTAMLLYQLALAAKAKHEG